MCGVVALYSPQQPVAAATLARGLAALAHRGPDGHGHWIAPSKRVGLGHARLSIIDLETGRQPIASHDEQLQVVVNGELYGYEAIQSELEQQGVSLRTRSDSEIVLHLYRERGFDCLQRLRGEFAFVLWDEREQRLFAARDRFGIKPLYYAQVGGQLYLASEAKALFALGVPARWDLWSLYQSCHLYYSQDRSLFAGVQQVPPGHYLVADSAGVRLVRYWDADLPELGQSGNADEREYVEATHDALSEAIRLRLRADVPLAFYLSGGLDSSVIVGMAQRMLSRPGHAFTICFDQDAYNEEAIASETARAVGLEYHPVRVGEEQIADHFAAAIGVSETINANTNGVAKYLLSRAVREAGFKVVLTGEGADEVFGGYAFLVRDHLLHLSRQGGAGHAEAAELLKQLRGPGLPQSPQTAEHPMFRGVATTLGFVPSFFQAHMEQLAMFEPLFQRAALRTLPPENPFEVLLRSIDLSQLAGRSPFDQSTYLWLRSIFPNFLLNQLADRMEMGNSIEGRVPFLDHKLFETVRSMPNGMKVRGLTEKYVLREAARPYLTETTYGRKKHAFWAPPSGLNAKGRLHSMLQDTVRAGVRGGMPLFDGKAVLRLLDRLPALSEEGPHALHGVSAMLTFLASVAVLHARYRPA